MKLVQFHDADGVIIAFDAERFCYARTYTEAPSPGLPAPDLHATVICETGMAFRVQESIDKVYEILKEVA